VWEEGLKLLKFVDGIDEGDPANRNASILKQAYGQLEHLRLLLGFQKNKVDYFRVIFQYTLDDLYLHVSGEKRDEHLRSAFGYIGKKTGDEYLESTIKNKLAETDRKELTEETKRNIREEIRRLAANRYRKQFARYNQVLGITKDHQTLDVGTFLTYIGFFAEVYFLVGFGMRKKEFFGGLNRDRIRDAEQFYRSIGERLMEAFRQGTKTEREANFNDEGEEVRMKRTEAGPVREEPRYRIISKYEILDSLQDSLPYPLANGISDDDAKDIGREYFLAEQPPLHLTFLDWEGYVTGAVFVKCPLEVYRVFLIRPSKEVDKETAEYLHVLEITEKICKGKESFIEFFEDFIQCYNLYGEPDDDTRSDAGDILDVFETLVRDR